MAPKRGRKGLTRMDAALDQMSILGFSKQLVRKTVRNLLKEYGGDDGWTFIEENGYRVLLDVLLNEQENTEADNALKDNSSQHERNGDQLAIVESCERVAESVSLTKIKDASLANYAEGDNGECCKDIALDETSIQEKAICAIKAEEHFENEVKLQKPKPVSNVAQIPDNVFPRKRKPCYGWISDDDEDWRKEG